jgi:hypothetical protein
MSGTAILILLACTTDPQQCREMRMAETYASLEACRAVLPELLSRHGRSGVPAVGRCVTEMPPSIDLTTTAAVGSELETTDTNPEPEHQAPWVSVRVTRLDEGQAVVTEYKVLQEIP